VASELAVLIPTRGRPENIRRVIGAWDFTNAWDVADMIVVADADDPEIGGYRAIFAEDDALPARLVVMDEWMPMVHKLDRVAVELAGEGAYFALGFAGDDHLPQTINWAKTYLAELHKLGTGMVYGDDGYQGRKLSTEWAITADAVRALGRMVPAPVEHMYCDNSIMELFEAAGALAHLPGVRIEHRHPIAGKAESDAQYKRVNSRNQFATDKAAYDRWTRTEKTQHVQALAALRPGRPIRRVRKETIRMSATRPPYPKSFKLVKGLTPVDIEVTLADLAVGVPADQEIVELGVYHGKTALIMAWGAAQGGGAHVTAIDPWDLEGNPYPEELFGLAGAKAWARYHVRGQGYTNRITLVQNFSSDAAAVYQGPPIGLLFIDGDHDYAGAHRDVTDWAPYLAPGATIAVDDYGNPDYPGVKMALDDLVEAGVVEPLELFHERLAVTRLVADPSPSPKAITSEGVTPSPVTRTADIEGIGPVVITEEPDARPDLDTSVSDRGLVQEGELEGVAAGTPVDQLTIPQMKTLARGREIVLGARKDKRAEIVQALRDGR
jgi:predicted O-methyltransferase YrrM